MGLPIRELYVTNVGEISTKNNVFMSAKWKPIKVEKGRYMYPPHCPIGLDLWIPNVLNLKEEDGTVSVKIVESKEETGLWLICYDDFFGDEQHLYNFKPHFIEGTNRIDSHYNNEMMMEDESDEDYWQLHVGTDIKMVTGDGPIPVTLEIINE